MSGNHAWGSDWEKQRPEHLAWKASGAQRDGGNMDSTLKRHTQAFMCAGSQGKAETPKESGSDLTAVLGGSSMKTG